MQAIFAGSFRPLRAATPSESLWRTTLAPAQILGLQEALAALNRAAPHPLSKSKRLLHRRHFRR